MGNATNRRKPLNRTSPSPADKLASTLATPTSRADEIRRRRMKGEVTRGEVTRGENGRGESARAAAKKSSGPSGWRSDRNRRVGPPEPPPVMVRGRDPSAFGVPTTPLRSTKKGSQRARRTYNVALGNQGAEMRLPALPHIHIGWRVASFLLAGLLIYGLYSLWNSSLYRVESAEIYGLQRVGANLVSSVLDVNDKPVFALNSQTMQQDLLATFPEFSSAVISIELPNTVVVTVTERVPVLIWRQDGRSSLVDINGYLFPVRDESVETNLPLVEAAGTPPLPTDGGIASQSAPSPSMLDFSLSLGLEAEAPVAAPARHFLFREMVSAILLLAEKAPEGATLIYDPQHGLGWKDRRDWNVYFGVPSALGQSTLGQSDFGPENFQMKLQVYKAILDYLKAQDTKPALISVEHVYAPYYRLEP